MSAAPALLFDGQTFTGWQDDAANIWRSEGNHGMNQRVLSRCPGEEPAKAHAF